MAGSCSLGGGGRLGDFPGRQGKAKGRHWSGPWGMPPMGTNPGSCENRGTMKTGLMRVVAILALLGCTSGSAQVERALIGTAPRETRSSLQQVPGSKLSEVTASLVAAQLALFVPGTRVYSVAPTGSMRPLIDRNALLLGEPAPFADLRIGDIVTFVHPRTGLVVVHRILERGRGGFWTKGDNCAAMDDTLVTANNYQTRIYGIIYTRLQPDGLAAAGAEGGRGRGLAHASESVRSGSPVLR